MENTKVQDYTRDDQDGHIDTRERNFECENTPWKKPRFPGGLCPYAAVATYLDIKDRDVGQL